jgi:polar amino acid transport system ATP-binding protein
MIAIDKVSKWYGATQVLRDVSMSVDKGEVVVVCGPSGSGKSTILRCINRLETVEQGTIVVDGIEVTGRAPDINRLRTEIGVVFQAFNLYPQMTVLRNITLAPMLVRKRSRAEAEEIARTLLRKVGIPRRRTRIPRSSPVASSNGSRSHALWPCSRSSCCSTSPRRRSTRR